MKRSIDDFYTPPPRTYHGRSKPPVWLLAVLGICAVSILLFAVTRMTNGGGQTVAAGTPSPSIPQETPSPTVTPSPSPSPSPTQPPPYNTPLPKGETMTKDWFSDAVLIGDSRTDGFKMYSGVTEADYIDYTGLSVYAVANDRRLIRVGEEKISVLDALAQKQYGKVYLCLGVNELGYANPDGYASTFGTVIDRVREIQPNAQIYVQSIIPVNAAECQSHNQPEYVTNDMIHQYNAALTQMAIDKQVPLVNVAEAFVDSNGELSEDISADGVHLQKKGYVLWRDYLLCHTGMQKSEEE